MRHKDRKKAVENLPGGMCAGTPTLDWATDQAADFPLNPKMGLNGHLI